MKHRRTRKVSKVFVSLDIFDFEVIMKKFWWGDDNDVKDRRNRHVLL